MYNKRYNWLLKFVNEVRLEGQQHVPWVDVAIAV